LSLRRGQDIPQGDHVLRHIGPSKLRRDENRNVVGVRGDAFKASDNDGLSVNWLEFIEGDEGHQIAESLKMMQAGLNIKKSAVLAKIHVQSFRELSHQEGYRIRVVYDPLDENQGHSEIRHLPTENDELLDMLADKGIVRRISCADFME
jgi:hypothetical protein